MIPHTNKNNCLFVVCCSRKKCGLFLPFFREGSKTLRKLASEQPNFQGPPQLLAGNGPEARDTASFRYEGLKYLLWHWSPWPQTTKQNQSTTHIVHSQRRTHQEPTGEEERDQPTHFDAHFHQSRVQPSFLVTKNHRSHTEREQCHQCYPRQRSTFLHHPPPPRRQPPTTATMAMTVITRATPSR